MPMLPSDPLIVTLNGKEYPTCTVTIEHRWGPRHVDIDMVPQMPHAVFLSPLVVNYQDTITYRRELMEQQTDVIIGRIQTLFPDCSAYALFTDGHHDEPTVDTAWDVEISVRWQDTPELTTVGSVPHLIWISDGKLSELINTKIEACRKAKREKEAHADRIKSDPLLPWHERIERVGYGAFWRIVPSPYLREGVLGGDTLVFVCDLRLRAYEQYILIGTFTDLCCLNDKQLNARIQEKFDEARKKFGCNI